MSGVEVFDDTVVCEAVELPNGHQFRKEGSVNYEPESNDSPDSVDAYAYMVYMTQILQSGLFK